MAVKQKLNVAAAVTAAAAAAVVIWLTVSGVARIWCEGARN